MNRWKLPVAALAAFGLISLNAVAQNPQDKTTSGDPSQTTASQDTPPQQQDASQTSDTDSKKKKSS